MKKLLYIIPLIFGLTACEKTLEETPKDRLAETNFYQSAADAQAAVYAIYSPIRDFGYYGANMLLFQESLSDIANGRGSYAPISEYAALDGTNTGRSEGIWTQAYRAILRANIVLDKVPAIAMDENAKKALLAEARFMRGLVYFDLVRNWGGVPIRSSANDAADIPRSGVDEVYAFITQDLQAAETDLPNTPATLGRPTKWSAKTLLSSVYLTTEKWTLARDKAKEVMDANLYSLVPVSVSADFDKIFGATVTTSSEDIFSLKFSSAGGQGFQYLLYIHAENTQFGPPGFRTIFARETYPLISSWSNADLRKDFNLYHTYTNRTSGQTVTLPANEYYQFKKFKDPASVAANASGNDLPLLRYADVLLIYAEAASQAVGGPTPEAYEALNKVRRRAYGKPVNTSDATVDLAGLNQTTFREAVLKDRAYEFITEGKRWYDMRRLGKVRSRELIQAAKAKTVAEAAFLWPIPKVEIDNNGAINPSDQNPGY